MSFDKESATARATQDLSGRLGVATKGIETISVKEKDFPDMALGAPIDDEMSAQMISSGWEITLKANGKFFEYRADKYQLRLFNFNGANYIVVS
ncbi:MAG: hypothetical protein ACK5NT_09880 [Pyrinomonadaceae bacterium]